jgi:chromosome segregation ATPase
MFTGLMQEAQAAQQAERTKLLAANASLRREVTAAKTHAKRLQDELERERAARRGVEKTIESLAQSKKALEAACEHAAAETSDLHGELARLKSRLTRRSAAAHQAAQVCSAGHL